jgi:hypothetical protein
MGNYEKKNSKYNLNNLNKEFSIYILFLFLVIIRFQNYYYLKSENE